MDRRRLPSVCICLCICVWDVHACLPSCCFLGGQWHLTGSYHSDLIFSIFDNIAAGAASFLIAAVMISEADRQEPISQNCKWLATYIWLNPLQKSNYVFAIKQAASVNYRRRILPSLFIYECQNEIIPLLLKQTEEHCLFALARSSGLPLFPLPRWFPNFCWMPLPPPPN